MVTAMRPTPLADTNESPPILHGLSLNEVSRRSGIARPYLTKIFNGRSIPSAINIRLLAQALDCTMDDLYAYLRTLWDPNDPRLLSRDQ